MNQALRKDAQQILASSLQAVLPDEAVQRALRDFEPHGGRVLLVAAGKAAWQMAAAAVRTLGRVDGGVVVTKYHHVKGDIPGVVCCEGGHPVPDEGSFAATQKALELVQDLTAADDVLFLLSGGGSALFEKPLVPGAELQDITGQLLGCGADIVEMNTIRKRLSAVKGGRFARLCAPAQVYSIVLSDILAGYDRQRSRLPGQQHLCRCPGDRRKISAEAFPGGTGTAGAGDPQDAGQRHHPHYRQRPGAVRCRRKGVRRSGL